MIRSSTPAQKRRCPLSARPRCDQARSHREVHRLLPRPRRRIARRSRQRRTHPGNSILPRHPQRNRFIDCLDRIQRSQRRSGRLRKIPGQIACFVVEPSPATWASSRRAPIISKDCATFARSTRAMLLFDEVMTGFASHGIARKASTTSSPTSPASAKSSAAVSPSAHTAASKTSCP